MTSVDGGKERLVTVHAFGVGDASARVVAAAQEQGYSVAATGPGQFRMIRQRRPVWAVVAAILTLPILGIGLLFLLVKQTDSGSVSVFEGRDGTKVRVVGSIDDEVVGSVMSPASRGPVARAESHENDAGAASPGVPPDSVSPNRGPRNSRRSTPLPPEAESSSVPASPAVPPVSNSRMSGDASPFAAARGQASPSVHADSKTTGVRPSSTLRAGCVAIELPDGRSVPLSGGIVIGRFPRSPNGNTAMMEVPYPDSSLSRTHLVIESTDSGVAVTDLHSTNGTTIVEGGLSRGCPPGEAVGVTPGAEIRAGDVAIHLRMSR